MNKSQGKGRAEQVKGKTKETVGKLTGDDKLKYKGKAQKTVGKARAGAGDAKSQARKNT